MKTLVIHPDDETTAFLSAVYADKDWTIITSNGTPKGFLKEQIKAHDRIVMMGHGTELGLLGYMRYIIDSQWVYLLRTKVCVCIWCNANVFVERYGLNGFYTGMIISELREAVDYSVEANEDEILQSNLLFTDCVKNSIDSENMLAGMVANYTGETNVILFNKNNLYQTNEK